MGWSFWNRIGSSLGGPGGPAAARRRRGSAIGRGAVERLEPRVVLATFTVTSPGDGGPGSLRDAIEQANRTAEENTITIDRSVGDAIVLTGPLPILIGDLRIEGPEGDPVAIVRDPSPEAEEFRILTIAEGADVVLKSLVLSGGRAQLGGAIYNDGALGLEFSTVSGNFARFKGGGVYNRGWMTIYHSKIDGNEVEGATTIGFGPAGIGRGGGVYNDGFTAVLTSSITNNRANREGGGIYNEGTFTIRAATISGNVAEGFVLAGGLVPYGRGGGIFNTHSIQIDAATIAENAANRIGGGIFSNVNRGGSDNSNPYRIEDSTIRSSIVADNVNGNLVVKTGTFVSQGNNLFGDEPGIPAQPTDLAHTDPMLTPLGDHGGFSPTHGLLPGSPALDVGAWNPDFTLDQRAFGRPEGAPDIGAFESTGFDLAVVSGGAQSALPGSAFPEPLVVSVTARDTGVPVAGGMVTFSSPVEGASAVVSGSPAAIGPDGRAGVRAVAGSVPGTYAVVARTGAGSSVPFALTNEGTPPPAAPGVPTPAASSVPAPAVPQRPLSLREAWRNARTPRVGAQVAAASHRISPADRAAIREALRAGGGRSA